MPDEQFKKKESPVPLASPRRVETGPEIKRGESFASLRTMREDITSLSQQRRSPADMVTREPSVFLGQREQLAREFASARYWRAALIASIVAALLIGVGIVGFFLLFPAAPPSDEEEIVPAFLPFSTLHHEEIQFRLGDREGFLALLNQKKQRAAATHDPTFLSLRLFSLEVAQTRSEQPHLAKSRQASVFEVFQTLRFRPPSLLLRAFNQEIYSYILADALVFIVPINNPEKALEGFLAWEPLMIRDFTSLLPADTLSQPFEDRIISNVDARISSSLSYGLFGGRYAIIAMSERALRGAIERLSARVYDSDI